MFRNYRNYGSAILIPSLSYLLHHHLSPLSSSCQQSQQKGSNSSNYKYVVVGYGIAGKNALNELLKDQNKDSSILIIEKKSDILLPTLPNSRNHIHSTTKSIESIVSNEHQIILEDGEKITYKKLLISCGRQYGVKNFEFVDTRTKSKILSLNSNNSMSILTQTVKNGGHVTLLGGSWVSIAFASYLAHEATLSGYTSSVTLLFPGAGPLHEILPRPFSVAIMNRLKRIGVEVYPYMQLRYIGVKESLTDIALPTRDLTTEGSPNSLPNSSADGNKFSDWENIVGVHCVQSYDLLKTYMFATDYIVPICELTNDNNNSLDSTAAKDRSSDFNSFLFKSGFEVDQFGCLVVNPSLAVVDDVYAAGDIANIYSANGRGYDVGLLSATATGSIAGQNMLSSLSSSSSSLKQSPVNAILSSEIINTYHATALLMGANIRFYGDCTNSYDMFCFWWHNATNNNSNSNSNSNNKDGKDGNIKQTISDPNILEEKSADAVGDTKKTAIIPLGKLLTRKITLSNDHIPLNFSLHSAKINEKTGGGNGNGGSGSSSRTAHQHQSETDILGTGIIFYLDSNRIIRGVAVCGTRGNPYYLNHFINMSPAYVKAASFLGHYVDLPSLSSSSGSSSVSSNKRTTRLPVQTSDINQQIKYLEGMATNIFNEIQVNNPNIKANEEIIKFNKLEEKPRCKYYLSGKKIGNEMSDTSTANKMTRLPWRLSIQSSHKNEKIFH